MWSAVQGLIAGKPASAMSGGGAQGVGFQLVGKVAQGLDPAGFGFVDPFLDRREHVMPVAAGLEPDLLQRQALS